MKRLNFKYVQLAVCFILVFSLSLLSGVVLGREDNDYNLFASDGNKTEASNMLATSNNKLSVMAREGDFIYGINVPWISLGKDFGADALELLKDSDAVPDYRYDSYKQIIHNCSAIGFNGMRLWLLTGAQGIRFTEYGDVLGLDEYFLDNLKTTLDLAVEYKMGLDIVLQPRMSYNFAEGDKAAYDVTTQFMVNPEYRKHYFERVVKPVCELLNSYKSSLLAVTVYAEPESDIYGEKNHIYGTDKSKMLEFVSESCKFVRGIMPDTPISVSALMSDTATADYMGLDIDILGVHTYNNSGEVESPKMLNSEVPMWLGECGPNITYSSDNTNEGQTALMMNFYDNAKEKGYIGAFWWAYNYVLPFSVIFAPEDYSGLRPSAVVLHNTLLDNSYIENGIELGTVADKPSLLYSNDPVYLMWIGCREAESYTIEHSLDGKNFNVLEADIDPDKVTNEHGICAYSLENVKKANCDYTYRITVKTFDGFTAVSDTHTFYLPKITVPEDENVVKNPKFETGDYTDWITSGNVGINDNTNSYHINGSYTACLSPGASISQVIDVTPNTRFIFSMRLRTTTTAKAAKLCIYGGPSQSELMYEFVCEGIQTWDQTVTKLFDEFDTGDNEKLRIEITDLSGNILMVDDVAVGVG